MPSRLGSTDRVGIMLLLAWIGLMTTFAGAGTAGAELPKIVIVHADDLGDGALSCDRAIAAPTDRKSVV